MSTADTDDAAQSLTSLPCPPESERRLHQSELVPVQKDTLNLKKQTNNPKKEEQKEARIHNEEVGIPFQPIRLAQHWKI